MTTPKTLEYPDALRAAGVNVVLLNGWDEPRKNGYVWRDTSGMPVGHMHHHTATSSYVPNRDKANAYAGLLLQDPSRLYQEDYTGEGIPTYAIANAYPAPISSGAGDMTVIDKVKARVEVNGRQGADNGYGNTYFWNTEWVINGIGAVVDPKVWDMMATVCAVQNDIEGWDHTCHICHGHWTRRKIDLVVGLGTFQATIEALRRAMTEKRGSGMWANDWTDKSWMTFFDDTDIPGVVGSGRYYCSDDGTYDFTPPFGSQPNDGGAAYGEKIHAINYVFSGFALALDQS